MPVKRETNAVIEAMRAMTRKSGDVHIFDSATGEAYHLHDPDIPVEIALAYVLRQLPHSIDGVTSNDD